MRTLMLVQTCTCVNEMVLYSLFPSKWSESTCYCTQWQRIDRGHSGVVEVETSSIESYCSTSQFLTHSDSPDTFIIAKASTQKED